MYKIYANLQNKHNKAPRKLSVAAAPNRAQDA